MRRVDLYQLDYTCRIPCSSTRIMQMIGFEWISPLCPEEKHALRGYKDQTWERINRGLRAGNLPDDDKEQVRLLDQAIAKGRNTAPMTLFRATSTGCLKVEGDLIHPDLAFLSMSLRDGCIGQFFGGATPAKLVVECAPQTPMAAFEHDDRGGEESERLLPRGMAFRIKATRTVQNYLNIFEPEGPFNRSYLQLGRDVNITIYTLEPLRRTTVVNDNY